MGRVSGSRFVIVLDLKSDPNNKHVVLKPKVEELIKG